MSSKTELLQCHNCGGESHRRERMNGVGITYLWASKEFPPFIRLDGRRGDYEVYTPERTCEMYRDNCGTWHCKSCEHGADTITGSGGVLESWSDSWPPNYCPNCGARVVDV